MKNRPNRLACFIAWTTLLTGAATPATHAADRPPNVILILADDLGWGDLGCYGNKSIRTPNLDRMAAEGLRFTQAYAGSTVCLPSRAVLMTGLHTGHTHQRTNSGTDMRPADVTVAEVLKHAGYSTGIIGKWALGRPGSTGVPTKQGFDVFFGYLTNGHAHNYYPSYLYRGEEREPLPNVVPDERKDGRGVATEKVKYSNDVMLDEALAFVEHRKDKPFFLYLPFTIPHANNEAKQEGMEVPDLGDYAKHADWPAPRKGHAAMITRMDGYVGRLIEHLKKLGLDDETLILFSSDNGPHREGGYHPDMNDSNGPLRGHKRDLYEGGIRVPLIARWPGHVPAGRTSDHVVMFTDVLPTLAALADVPAEKLPAHDGISFASTLLNRPADQPTHKYLYWEFYEQGGKQAVRAGDLKAIRMPLFNGKTELYDLSNDPGETRDLAAERPQAVKRLEAMMDEAHTPPG